MTQMETTDPDIAAVAGKLTSEEREALLSLPEYGLYADEYTNPPWPNIHMRARLGDLGQMRPGAVFRHGFGLTSLGQAVRAHLLENGSQS